MYCTNSMHDHSREEVVVAEHNITEPHGILSYHCPECGQANRRDKVQGNWTSMSLATAISQLRSPHQGCFPARGAVLGGDSAGRIHFRAAKPLP